ncbi:hypothetical protein ACJ41O_005519 [Fusarium nematophilum]
MSGPWHPTMPSTASSTSDSSSLRKHHAPRPPTVSRFRTLLRSIGLSILTFLRGDSSEPPKVLYESSFRVALARCAVHLVPAVLSVGLITLNMFGYFIGDELEGVSNQDNLKMGLLQIAAKVQELLIVGSVGSVIFHVLRSELVFGAGVPLGLLVSGFSFSQLSYFWSAEFLGGLSCGQAMTGWQRFRRWFFVTLVVIGGGLALLAGPATALLMIPRVLEWPVGGGIFWLNGSDAELWPTTLNASYYSVDCSDKNLQLTDSRCPGSGFLPLYKHFTTFWNYHDTGYSVELSDKWMRKEMYARPALIADANTWAYTAHAATATMQDAVRGLHYEALRYLSANQPGIPPFPAHLVWADPMRFEVETKVPAARVFCQPQGMMDLESGNMTVKFPNLDGFDDYWDGKPAAEERDVLDAPVSDEVDVLESVQRHLSARGILDSKSSLSDSIFDDERSILTVPIDLWNTSRSSLGVVILLGITWNRTDTAKTRPSNVMACSVDARWAKANTVMEMTMNTQLPHEFHLGSVRNLVKTELEWQPLIGYGRAKPPKNASMEVIRMSPDWYDVLAPVLPEERPDDLPWLPPFGAKQTTIEALMKGIYVPSGVRQAEFENLIATTLVDGLSRCGLEPNTNGSRLLEAWPFGDWSVNNETLARTLVRKGDPVESFPRPSILKSSTRLEMKAIFTGYVMAATGWFDYLSIAGLCIHALIAVVHTVLVVLTGRTSGAWDSILELVCLTQRSPPPPEPLLANTSAGVRSFKTVRLVASVDAPMDGPSYVKGDGSTAVGELRMRLRDGVEGRDERTRPVVGRVYGVPPVGYGRH